MIVRYIVERLFNEKWAIAKEIPFNVGSVEKANELMAGAALRNPFDLHRVQERIDHLVRVLDANIALAEKWERQLTQSQTEKYRYVELYETTKRELAAALRINAFREAQIASLRKQIATLEEPKLPRMVSHKPAATK